MFSLFILVKEKEKSKQVPEVEQSGKTVYDMNVEETDGSRILMLQGNFEDVEKPLLLVKILFAIQKMVPL